MSKITRKQFLADVKAEVEALKANATPEEISKLNFETFNHMKPKDCIYGQMTGDCKSPRAKELMDSACVRVMKDISGVQTIAGESFSFVQKYINGEYTGQTWGKHGRYWEFLSMVESYICLSGSKPENIIAYLKGEVETLVLPLD